MKQEQLTWIDLLLLHRDLNGNSLSGRVPAALGGRLLHGASFKYVLTNFQYVLHIISKLVVRFDFVPIVYRNRCDVSTVFLWSGRSFTDNSGLCGIPGLPACGTHLSAGAKIGIGLGACVAFLLIGTCLTCWWKRRQNILRAQKIACKFSANLISGLVLLNSYKFKNLSNWQLSHIWRYCVRVLDTMSFVF